jgi:allantoinase
MKPQPYGPFEYSPIVRRPPLRWPNGARVALWVIPNIEFFSLEDDAYGTRKVTPPGVPDWAARDFGNRIGIFRLMKVLDKHDIRGTVALNSNVCRFHPEIINEAKALDWEFMGHCETNTTRLNAVPPDQERSVIARTCAAIADATGERPRGWLGAGLQETWNTLDNLAAEGLEYVSDWVNDEQPYLMKLENGKSLISMPYSNEINDKPVYDTLHMSSAEFGGMIKRQFDVLYREGEESGRVMAIALHPYLSGHAHRIDHLDEALRHICSHQNVWLATGAEIAEHYRHSVVQPPV